MYPGIEGSDYINATFLDVSLCCYYCSKVTSTSVGLSSKGPVRINPRANAEHRW